MSRPVSDPALPSLPIPPKRISSRPRAKSAELWIHVPIPSMLPPDSGETSSHLLVPNWSSVVQQQTCPPPPRSPPPRTPLPPTPPPTVPSTPPPSSPVQLPARTPSISSIISDYKGPDDLTSDDDQETFFTPRDDLATPRPGWNRRDSYFHNIAYPAPVASPQEPPRRSRSVDSRRDDSMLGTSTTHQNSKAQFVGSDDLALRGRDSIHRSAEQWQGLIGKMEHWVEMLDTLSLSRQRREPHGHDLDRARRHDGIAIKPGEGDKINIEIDPVQWLMAHRQKQQAEQQQSSPVEEAGNLTPHLKVIDQVETHSDHGYFSGNSSFESVGLHSDTLVDSTQVSFDRHYSHCDEHLQVTRHPKFPSLSPIPTQTLNIPSPKPRRTSIASSERTVFPSSAFEMSQVDTGFVDQRRIDRPSPPADDLKLPVTDDKTRSPVLDADDSAVFDEPSGPHNVVFEYVMDTGQGTVTKCLVAATKIKLVEYLTKDADYEFVADFFVGYRAYMSPKHLLRLWMARYKWGLRRADDPLYEKVRAGTFTVMYHWIVYHWDNDYARSKKLRHKLLAFLNEYLEVHPVIDIRLNDAQMVAILKNLVREQRVRSRRRKRQEKSRGGLGVVSETKPNVEAGYTRSQEVRPSAASNASQARESPPTSRSSLETLPRTSTSSNRPSICSKESWRAIFRRHRHRATILDPPIESQHGPLSTRPRTPSAPPRPSYVSPVLVLPAKAFAQQFCLFEQKLVLDTHWTEFLDAHTWTRRTVEAEGRAPGVWCIIDQFNGTCRWVVEEVSKTAEDDKSKVLERFVQIAELCLAYNNFSTLLSILLAFQSPQLSNMRCWSHLSATAAETLHTLQSFATPFLKFTAIRAAHKRCVEAVLVPEWDEPPPLQGIRGTKGDNMKGKGRAPEEYGAVPFLGLFLSDLVFNEELEWILEPFVETVPKSKGSSSSQSRQSPRRTSSIPLPPRRQSLSEETQLINIRRARRLAGSVRSFRTFQQPIRRYGFETVEEVWRIIENLGMEVASRPT